MGMSPTSADSNLRNRFNTWAKAAFDTGYTFRDDAGRPAWARWEVTKVTKTRVSGKRLGAFPNTPVEVAALLNTSDFGDQSAKDCRDGETARFLLVKTLPPIIARLEGAGLGDHWYVKELRWAQVLVERWVADNPEPTFTKPDGYITVTVGDYVFERRA